MKQLHEMAYAMRDALEAGEPDRLGAMLHEAFEAKKRMNPHIAEHTPIDAMLGAAREAGATGGKICGAGGGGYLMVYAVPRRSRRSATRSRVSAARSPPSGSAPRACAPSATASRGRRRDSGRMVLVDRDGTIDRCEAGDYILSPDRIELLPGAADGLRLLREAGLRLAVVTNQAAIGRGWIDSRPPSTRSTPA